jgi:hypothetical protein
MMLCLDNRINIRYVPINAIEIDSKKTRSIVSIGRLKIAGISVMTLMLVSNKYPV